MLIETFFYPDDEIAERLGVTTRCAWNWAKQGRIPKPVKLTRRASRWWWPGVVEFIHARQGEASVGAATAQNFDRPVNSARTA